MINPVTGWFERDLKTKKADVVANVLEQDLLTRYTVHDTRYTVHGILASISKPEMTQILDKIMG
jgi:hypothetical protein